MSASAKEQPTPAVGALGGAFGSAFGLVATYPLTVLKTKLQAQRKNPAADVKSDGPAATSESARVLDCIQQVLAADGLGGFYRGIQLKVPETFLWNGTFYYCFTKIKPLFDRAFGTSGRKAGFAQSMAHGIVSGMLTQLCMFPFVVVNTRVTTYGENDGPKKSENIGWLERYARVCRQVYREGGLAAFWKGILAGLILTINPGIVATLKLRLSALAAGLEGRTSARQNFWIGFFSKLLASTITYPLVVCRTQMVVDQGSDGAIGLLDRFELMRATFARVVAEAGGISGLYAGVAPHLGQAALKEAIANTIRLKMYALAFNILSAKK